MSDYHYAVLRLATPVIRPLKPKHIKLLVAMTFRQDLSMSDFFRTIQPHIMDHHWVVVMKALAIVHILMNDGNTERVVGYLASNPERFNMTNFKDRSGRPEGTLQTENIKSYGNYLKERVSAYREIKTDWVKDVDGAIARFRSVSVEEGLLTETIVLQRQVDALLDCTWLPEDLDQVVSLQAFRLLFRDLLCLFHILNECAIRILSVYFELEKSNAAKALQIYKKFALQTKKVLEFFEVGRKVSNEANLTIPEIKHAPVSLVKTLEDYLNAPDFEAQREAYRKRKEGKKNNKYQNSDNTAGPERRTSVGPRNNRASTVPQTQLIDFFSSIDDHVDGMRQNQTQFNANQAFDPFWNPNDPFMNPSGFEQQQKPFQETNPFATMQVQQNQINQQLQLTNNLMAATALTSTESSPFMGNNNNSPFVGMQPNRSLPPASLNLSNPQFLNGGSNNPSGLMPASAAMNPASPFGPFQSSTGMASPMLTAVPPSNNPFSSSNNSNAPNNLGIMLNDTNNPNIGANPFTTNDFKPQVVTATTNPVIDPFGFNNNNNTASSQNNPFNTTANRNSTPLFASQQPTQPQQGLGGGFQSTGVTPMNPFGNSSGGNNIFGLPQQQPLSQPTGFMGQPTMSNNVSTEFKRANTSNQHSGFPTMNNSGTFSNSGSPFMMNQSQQQPNPLTNFSNLSTASSTSSAQANPFGVPFNQTVSSNTPPFSKNYAVVSGQAQQQAINPFNRNTQPQQQQQALQSLNPFGMNNNTPLMNQQQQQQGQYRPQQNQMTNNTAFANYNFQ